MERSPNQFTEPMRRGAAHSPFWEHLDSVLVIEEARLAEQKRWMEHDAHHVIVDDPYATLEARLGHLMMFGKITAEQAYDML